MRARISPLFVAIAACALFAGPSVRAEAPAAPAAAQDVTRQIDKQMSIASDYKGVVQIREKLADGTERALELTVYRRDSNEDLLFMVTKPPSVAGAGYLRIDKNLWEYSVSAGLWGRRTRRADLVGTVTCESDFDRSRLSVDYDAVEEAPESINGVAYRKLLLTVKPGLEVTFTQLRLWVDPELKIVKRVGYGPSGKPLRTDIIRSYQKLKDPATGKEFLHWREVVERQEEVGTINVVRYEQVELAPLPPNIFTKAWVEGRLNR
jgi:hypothetical protein